MPTLSFKVVDAQTGNGIKGVKIKIYEDQTGPVDPETTPTIYLSTDENGEASRTVLWQFDCHCGVGVLAEGYEAAEPDYAPPEGWKDKWTCWHEFDYTQTDYSYQFKLNYVGVPQQSMQEQISELVNAMIPLVMNVAMMMVMMSLISTVRAASRKKG